MRNCEEKEERLMLLESWKSFEEECGTDTTKERVDKLMPEKVKKRRKIQAEDGVRIKAVAVTISGVGLVGQYMWGHFLAVCLGNRIPATQNSLLCYLLRYAY